MLFDTHAHYDDEAYRPGPRPAAAGEPARQRGVALVLNPGCDIWTAPARRWSYADCLPPSSTPPWASTRRTAPALSTADIDVPA